MTELDYDIAICGAGPAGMALAALLVRRGVAASRIALIDAKTLEQAGKDPRSLALSWGSRQILEPIGGWPAAATAIEQIHVSRRGQFGRSMIDRKDYDLPALGYVSRYGHLVSALGAVCERAGIASLRPARVEALDESEDAVTLTLSVGDKAQTLRAAIVVQAEGGLFNEQQTRATNRDYEQTAIIAQVRSSAPPPHRAYERFTEQGPLALLPQDDEYSLVWCVRPHTAAELQALNDADFLQALGAAFGDRVGRFTHATARLAFPLGLNADPRSSTRTVAIGNAAQTLHPVAGQGLNLGLRDVTVLARLLAHGATPTMLSQFTELRQRDRNTTVRITDTMARIFANDSPAQSLLGLSLAAIDIISPARSLLAELMMYGHR
ncbi:2-octaprenyl-6-methoxyphenol hydroxylase [Duganella sp. CF402]|uniref:UbiH/UbiF/VisC/COQ6 family ubiquinone biosynthesis hydroxylase n=1 Tax=unclassified Duganella TaxID=2636909 RepID=UPI0008B27B21|nr:MULTISPECIES: UbiH/UbiF/VisC/COQ6 family ubiquinone biosynthesis hydroxylase [unclassified Duganella]RZT08075.1 2-octaprenyl-6-methoxyphenol hydroxylase [Duganella sp. BK701]SEM06522.1 2-octaprenyl-6-methoxyphenol hydroxylase [Duganella sp. CF402]